MRDCRSCGAAFDPRFRYCPWCGAIQRLKVVEYFTAFPFSQADLNKGLRVWRAGRTFRGSEPQRGLKLTVPLVAPGGGLGRVCGLRGQRGSRSWVP